MPANVVLVEEVIQSIVNFSVVQESSIKDKIIEPIFGAVSDAVSLDEDGEVIEEDDSYENTSSGVKRSYKNKSLL